MQCTVVGTRVDHLLREEHRDGKELAAAAVAKSHTSECTFISLFSIPPAYSPRADRPAVVTRAKELELSAGHQPA